MVSGMQPLLKARIVFFVYFRQSLLNMKNCSGRIVQKKSSDIEEDIKISGGKAKMKYVRQFWIILLISAMGEALHVLIPLPVPASVYGLVIMLIALLTHIIKLDQVKEAAEFLIETMPVMFIPAGVGLLTAWGVLKPVCVPIILIVAITTVVVMIVTGRVTQAVIRMDRKKGQKKS